MFFDERAIICAVARGFVETASKMPEHTFPADYPMLICSGFVDYSRIYSASREGAWRWSVRFVASL